MGSSEKFDFSILKYFLILVVVIVVLSMRKMGYRFTPEQSMKQAYPIEQYTLLGETEQPFGKYYFYEYEDNYLTFQVNQKFGFLWQTMAVGSKAVAGEEVDFVAHFSTVAEGQTFSCVVLKSNDEQVDTFQLGVGDNLLTKEVPDSGIVIFIWNSQVWDHEDYDGKAFDENGNQIYEVAGSIEGGNDLRWEKI